MMAAASCSSVTMHSHSLNGGHGYDEAILLVAVSNDAEDVCRTLLVYHDVSPFVDDEQVEHPENHQEVLELAIPEIEVYRTSPFFYRIHCLISFAPSSSNFLSAPPFVRFRL